MIIYPAIDIRGGKCVRLVAGDYARETVFDDDPVTAAHRWVEAGAEWLHIVDLDGARSGDPINNSTILRLRQAVDLPLQLGGGIRSADRVADLVEAGINRVIIGTMALKEPDLLQEIVRHHGDAIAVALDARSGFLAAEGWLEQTATPIAEVARRFRQYGVAHFIVTDIDRDGTLAGADVSGIQQMVSQLKTGVIASGGAGGMDDVHQIRNAGAAGLVVGRALYDGRLDLAGAIAAGKEGPLVA